LSTDILIITGLKDELDAVLQLGPGGAKGWSNERDAYGFPYHARTFLVPNEPNLHVAASWAGAMGETASTDRSRMLIDHLAPLTLGMCGICAGRRGDVFLGDVILADRVFSYDHGKLIATTGTDGHRIETLFHDIETYNLEKVWAMNASYFAEDGDAEWRQSLNDSRPLSLDSQRQWLLRSIDDHQQRKAEAPQNLVERSKCCPDWTRTLESLEKLKLIEIKNGTIALTDAGKDATLRDRLYHPEGVRTDPPFRVHVGPIASGKTVRQDPELFQQIAMFSRKVLGVEMEAAAIGCVAERSSIPSVIAKAVSDYGDADKDDGFRKFACHAAASFLLAFVTKYPPRSILQFRAKRASSELSELHEGDVRRVLYALRDIGVIDAPEGAHERSLFYCKTGKGSRSIGVALNNSGLLAYVGDEPPIQVTSLNNDQTYEVSQLETRNRFLRFARVNGPTRGLVSAYVEQGELFDLDWSTPRWLAFDRNGKRIPLKLDLVSLAMRIPTADGADVWVDDLVSARTAADVDLIGGPVLSSDNELVGFLIATSQLPSERHQFVYIWPWVSLKKAMMEGQILESGTSTPTKTESMDKANQTPHPSPAPNP
jgi:nucleoside phosphorylase